MNNTLAVILAGGRGQRMNILSKVRPKPVLPFAGSFRVVDFVLTNCLRSEISNVMVLTDYQREHMGNYISSWYQANGNSKNLHVMEPYDGSFTGTANAVYQNLDFIEKANVHRVLVLAADHVYKMDYRKMSAFHDKVGAEVTIGTITVPIQEAHRFGVLTVDNMRVQSFMEKPKLPKSNLVSMGIYIFDKDVLVQALKEDAMNPASVHDFGNSIVPNMVKGNRLFAYTYNDYWQDIGTVNAYYDANIELTRYVPALTLNSNWPVLTLDDHIPYTKVISKNDIANSIVGRDCVIKGRVENSVLSPSVRVEENAVVRNSIVMAGTVIGANSIVDGAILDEQVTVGDFCYIGFGSKSALEGKNPAVIGKGSIIPSHTAVGRNCTIPPGMTLLNSKTSVIQPDTVLQTVAA
jgi:glucose-1-phosphate adenylyltransferase